MPQTAIYDLIERLGTLLRAEIRRCAATHGLAAVQLQALQYLARCNKYSDTPAAVGEYLGSTKGTTSQTINSLVSKGLVEKCPDENDARVVHCKLRSPGRRIVEHSMPPPVFERALQSYEAPAQHEDMKLYLTEFLRHIQNAHGGRSFGPCRSCRFHQVEGKTRRCGLTGERLLARDIDQICREHQHPESEDSSMEE